MQRREFLGQVAGVVTAAGVVPSGDAFQPNRTRSAAPAATTSPAVRLGGPIFTDATDPEALAREHVRLGYRAAYCPKVDLNDTTRVRAIAGAFEKAGVVIAEVGRWVNLLEADPEKRRANLAYVTEGLALADAVGALCCVDIAGSYNTEVWYGPHPDNLSERFFDAAVENARAIIDAVKPTRAKFCYEMMGWSLPDSAESFLRLMKAVDRPAFGVHMDPFNLVNSPRRFYGHAALIDECFDLLGPWIVSCHAKDLKWEIDYNVHFREVRPGQGSIDYTTYLRRLAALPHQPPLMLEHLPNAEEYAAGRRHIAGLARQLGIDAGEV
jgi:sugar phosphate isomerase/epimerase